MGSAAAAPCSKGRTRPLTLGTARGTARGQAGPGAKPRARPQPQLPVRGSAEMPGADGQPELASATCQGWWSQTGASTAATSPPSLRHPLSWLLSRELLPVLPHSGVLRAPPEQKRSGPTAQPTTSSRPGAARPFGAVCSAAAPQSWRGAAQQLLHPRVGHGMGQGPGAVRWMQVGVRWTEGAVRWTEDASLRSGRSQTCG